MATAQHNDATFFDVYHKYDESSEDWQLAQTLQNYNAAQQPPRNNVHGGKIVIDPPTSQTSSSPRKQASPRSTSPTQLTHQDFDSITLPPPPESYRTDSPPKREVYAPYLPQIAARPQKALFATFPAISPTIDTGDSNMSAPLGLQPTGHGSFTAPTLVLGKRSSVEASNILNKPAKKLKGEDTIDITIPEPGEMPIVLDEDGRPPYSYSQLIGMAILRSPERKMTLAQIYKWIADTFKYYRGGGAGWQNSIRHNLSLNKAFMKKERPKDDPGKGHYWALVEGQETLFAKEKTNRRPTLSDQFPQAPLSHPISDDISRPASLPLPTTTYVRPYKSTRAVDSSQFPRDSDLSSDATLPASDPVDEETNELPGPPRLPQHHLSLPASPQMHSSPPVARNTPPQRYVPYSRSGSRAKRRDIFRDSGFYSSIESSLPRAKPTDTTLQLSSDADHNVPSRSSNVPAYGRAEEAIARMRSSSFDPSPSKSTKSDLASVFKKPALSTTLDSSSPLRPSRLIGPPPPTPGITLLPPAIKATPTISPGAHLRRHRESVRDLVGTPARALLTTVNGSGSNSGDSGTKSRKWSPLAFTEELELKLSPLRGVENEFAILDEDSEYELVDENDDLGCLRQSSPPLSEQAPPATEKSTAFSLMRSGTSDSPPRWSIFFASGSPVAPKAKGNVRGTGSGSQRAQISTNVLADITAGQKCTKAGPAARLASPFRMSPPLTGTKQGLHGVSPSKKTALRDVLEADAFWGVNNGDSSDENQIPGVHRGLDLAKGFRRIGAKDRSEVTTGKENDEAIRPRGQSTTSKGVAGTKTSRPPLGSSSTNI